MRASVLCIAMLGAVVAGCGANFADLLFQSGSAAGNTLLDLLLTEFANQVADGLSPSPSPSASPSASPTPTPGGEPNGAALFADNCASCHGADGASGFAPDISGFTADQLAAGLTSATHSSYPDFSDEELAAIAEFLGGGGPSPTPSPTPTPGADGAALFADNCAACHGADGASGFAPDVSGFTADQLASGLGSATHSSYPDFTDEELAAIADFLGGGGPSPTPTPTPGGDGAALFADNCAACHGADGASGFAPNISGYAPDQVAAGLLLGVHNSLPDFTDDEIAAISAFLGGS